MPAPTEPPSTPPPEESAEDRLRQLEKALETMQVGVTITDRERRIVYANPAEAAMHGYTVDELIGQPATIFAPPKLWKPLEPEDLKQVRSWRRESVNLRKDGSSFPVEILSDVVTDRDGEPIGIVSISQDITERRRAEEALRESEERYALAVRGANDGLWDWNLRNDEVYFSPRWKLMLGASEEEIGGSPEEWWKRVHPEDLQRVQADLAAHLDGSTESFQCEHRMIHADGTYRWMLNRGLAVRDEHGKPTRIAGSQTDITDRQVLDPLTKLPNRTLFLDRLGSALARARRRAGSLTGVLFLDLDRFKVVNDSLGHLAGDKLLESVARTLEGCLRPGDTVARIGGDEFTILLEDIREIADSLRVAERVHERLEQPVEIGDQEMFTTVSIGIACSSTGLESPQDLLRDADTAMYRAKSLGRGRHQLFDQDMRERVVAQLQIETDLRHALERDEFLVHYQPIVSLATEKIIGFEALIRWRHAERGMIMPLEFIPLAEETGLIVPIGEWVLREACRQLAEWEREVEAVRDLSVSVNLSPKQFAHPDLVRLVESALRDSALEPRRLELEITEGAFIENAEAAIHMMHQLRAMGVQVCIDDFGTGYSSLSYLHRFPVNSLKIDRSFIRRVDQEGKQVELVQTIIKMARDLGIDVVAEGVETPGQLARLKSLACDFGQGYSFSRPVEAQQVLEILRRLPRD